MIGMIHNTIVILISRKWLCPAILESVRLSGEMTERTM